jgi:hypothetical protein
MLAAFYKLLSVPLVKIALVGTAVTSGALVMGLPIHDPWFDYVLFIVASALVAGMPEPDTNLSGSKFAYLWLYRSAHLLVASATAYFIHKNKWADIDQPAAAAAAKVEE